MSVLNQSSSETTMKDSQHEALFRVNEVFGTAGVHDYLRKSLILGIGNNSIGPEGITAEVFCARLNEAAASKTLVASSKGTATPKLSIADLAIAADVKEGSAEIVIQAIQGVGDPRLTSLVTYLAHDKDYGAQRDNTTRTFMDRVVDQQQRIVASEYVLPVTQETESFTMLTALQHVTRQETSHQIGPLMGLHHENLLFYKDIILNARFPDPRQDVTAQTTAPVSNSTDSYRTIADTLGPKAKIEPPSSRAPTYD